MFKRLVCLFLLPIVAFSVFFGVFSLPVSSVKNERFLTVAIDAGHGGIDGGAVGKVTGAYESDINLCIAKKLKEVFERGGFNVVMTRTTNAGLYGVLSQGFKRRDMNERVKIVNDSKADIFISVHLNTYSDSARRGAQAFFKKGDENGKLFADCVQQKLNDMEECVKKTSALVGDYFVLNETYIPAIICEYGFLSNEKDEALLLDDEYQKKLALATFSGTLVFLASIKNAQQIL
ncbi:MAG: N-acetylmuramoyl-L-alanine amidase [Clostridia bacterium]|nr:N-acetylmuramoyl-L-alanine amidase [Clostridia bacterium]